MKLAIITDIHFDVRDGSQFFLDRYNDFFEKQFFPTLKKHNIKKVLCLGDTWENRRKLNVNAIKHAREMFFDKLEQYGIEFTSILGNHDVAFKNTNQVNSLDMFGKAYSNVNIINTNGYYQCGDKTIALVSWINRDNLESQLKFINESKHCDILAGHFEINGFVMTKGHYCDTGFEQDMFKDYKSVWSGHFHIRSTIGNISYLGNPFQTNIGDCGDKRGFHIYDSDTDTLEFIENEYPIYNTIQFNDFIDLTTFDFKRYKNQIVVIYVSSLIECNRKLLTLFTEKLQNVVYSFTVEETYKSNVNRNDVFDDEDVQTKSTTDIIFEYVDSTIQDTGKSSRVKTMMVELYNNALNVTGV